MEIQNVVALGGVTSNKHSWTAIKDKYGNYVIIINEIEFFIHMLKTETSYHLMGFNINCEFFEFTDSKGKIKRRAIITEISKNTYDKKNSSKNDAIKSSIIKFETPEEIAEFLSKIFDCIKPSKINGTHYHEVTLNESVDLYLYEENYMPLSYHHDRAELNKDSNRLIKQQQNKLNAEYYAGLKHIHKAEGGGRSIPSEAEGGGKPEAEGGGKPEAEGCEKPEAEGGGKPEAEGGGKPEAEGGEKPEAEGGGKPEAEGGGKPEAEGGGKPDDEAEDYIIV